MKKIVYLFTIILFIVLAGCGKKPISFQPAEGDLSVFGELVDDLLVISPDQSNRVSKKDAFEYLKSKGYSFYLSDSSLPDDPIEPEDAESYSVFHLKPSSILDYCTDMENSYISVYVHNDYVSSVLISLEGCEEEISNEARKYFNEAIANGVFDSYETEMSQVGDTDDWKLLDYEFYEQPPADNPSQEEYARVRLIIRPDAIFVGLVLHD